MPRTILVRGRMNGPRRIDLDEAVDELAGAVEIEVRPLRLAEPREAPARRKLLEVIRSLPPGTQSTDDLARQLVELGASWGDR